jgi:hypothetical protein
MEEMNMFEGIFAGWNVSEIWQQFSTFYNDFMGWYSALEMVEQIVVGAMIILGVIGAGYLIYGILWLAFQLVKAIVIGTVLMYFMGFVVIKLLITAIIDQGRVESEWQNSIKSMKYFVRHMYPNTTDEDLLDNDDKLDQKKKSQKVGNKENMENVVNTKTVEQTAPIQPQTKVITVKDTVDRFFCTNCGSAFTSAMENSVKNNHSCFCQYCGQMFVSQSDLPKDATVFIAPSMM